MSVINIINLLLLLLLPLLIILIFSWSCHTQNELLTIADFLLTSM